jgi:hypothetical protein
MNEKVHSITLLLNLLPHVLNGEDELANTRSSMAALERKESKDFKSPTTATTTAATSRADEVELTDEDKEEEKKLKAGEDNGDKDLRLLTSLLALPLADWVKELLTARDTNIFTSSVVTHLLPVCTQHYTTYYNTHNYVIGRFPLSTDSFDDTA